ncbi:MAG: hypothetical protein R3B69_04415 [Candidatus Paceibacterota bacterium]
MMAMIRTRDFFLYALILLFLCIGVGTTLIAQSKNTIEIPTVTHFLLGRENVAVVSGESANDRETTIARLREKLAQESGYSISRVPVFTSVDEPEPEPETSSYEVQRCLHTDDSTLLVKWPPLVTFSVLEGARVYSYQKIDEKTVGTTTIQATSTVTLTALPLQPLTAVSPACVREVVGLTPAGQPLVNSSAGSYQHLGKDALIGYALDGFPIYAVAPAEGLDTCGGTTENGTYRYQLRAGEGELIRCFTGIPQSVTLE